MIPPAGYEKPEGLSKLGEKAYQVIIGVLSKEFGPEGYSAGGGKVFYSPAEWKARGGEYGTNSELVIVYDGGDHARFFEYNYECYKLIEKMGSALNLAGIYTECCTHWYSSFYKA
jgi:hypothetical protein